MEVSASVTRPLVESLALIVPIPLGDWYGVEEGVAVSFSLETARPGWASNRANIEKRKPNLFTAISKQVFD